MNTESKSSEKYYMAQVNKNNEARCQEHGIIGQYADRDDALDAAAAHDTEHGYDGEAGEE
jgi:hypothetical protein